MTEAMLILLGILLLHYLYFLIKIYLGLNAAAGIRTGEAKENISVIIPFRNESENILTSLNSMVGQDYDRSKFEVIYVNDASTDDSLNKLCGADKPGNIKVISVPEGYLERGHKKRAVKYGIEQSRGDIIVTTDADCVHGSSWLKVVIGCFDKNTGFVSGPVEFSNSTTLFEKLQQLEFAGLILAGAGLIGSGTPVICNAANAAYRKKVFNEAGGFDMGLSSGDDELLMQKIHRQGKYKIVFCMDRRAVVSTRSFGKPEEFLEQRKRWASKGLFYEDKKLILKLVLIFLFYAGLLVQPVLAILIDAVFIYSFLISGVAKMFMEYLIIKRGERLLFKKGLTRYFIPAEVFQIPYILVAAIAGAAGGFKWKGRELER